MAATVPVLEVPMGCSCTSSRASRQPQHELVGRNKEKPSHIPPVHPPQTQPPSPSIVFPLFSGRRSLTAVCPVIHVCRVLGMATPLDILTLLGKYGYGTVAQTELDSRLALLLANVLELEQPSHGASSAANKGFRVPHSRGGSPVPQNRDPWHRGRRKPPEVPQLELRQRLAADPLGAWPLSCLPLARAEEGSPSRYCCSVPGRHKPGSNNSSCWRCRQRYN